MAAGPVIGDGGFVFELEKRGYVKAGPWTPEAAVEDPEAVRQLHREFLRAGSDVMQAFTFYASEDKLMNRGNKAGQMIGVEAINRAAAELAKSVAMRGMVLFLEDSLSAHHIYRARERKLFRKSSRNRLMSLLTLEWISFFARLGQSLWHRAFIIYFI